MHISKLNNYHVPSASSLERWCREIKGLTKMDGISLFHPLKKSSKAIRMGSGN